MFLIRTDKLYIYIYQAKFCILDTQKMLFLIGMRWPIQNSGILGWTCNWLVFQHGSQQLVLVSIFVLPLKWLIDTQFCIVFIFSQHCSPCNRFCVLFFVFHLKFSIFVLFMDKEFVHTFCISDRYCVDVLCFIFKFEF